MTPVEENVTSKKATPTPEQHRQLLLNQLVYEMNDKPIYYAGYRDVLNGAKEVEEIMGSSGLQSFLVEIVQRFLFSHLFNTSLRIMASEVGVQIRKKKWLSCDIAIYEKERRIRIYE